VCRAHRAAGSTSSGSWPTSTSTPEPAGGPTGRARRGPLRWPAMRDRGQAAWTATRAATTGRRSRPEPSRGRTA
jgi:hypothetical protein